MRHSLLIVVAKVFGIVGSRQILQFIPKGSKYLFNHIKTAHLLERDQSSRYNERLSFRGCILGCVEVIGSNTL
jgi:hypothetical protein